MLMWRDLGPSKHIVAANCHQSESARRHWSPGTHLTQRPLSGARLFQLISSDQLFAEITMNILWRLAVHLLRKRFSEGKFLKS
ncbi:hypothetical protein MPTK1_1g29290 [Marchantia polymorpha subsp. ruderalis]|uniref:Uncharacterized protein n=2 Tax=Marchantia polymorpha TaxID=3197 RepID=A0AAF6AVH8_MARPO|nr:hypothetical protein MARPO_0107s0044 [Marchantia polymorpha]BBN00449.1 hypothetical protein Mp_1g29290 [Marchantia polymorpha subsp. ruderalis]|eukprot:PTQ31777.1 hypothetical protein MARPO_0107s0044 [Marchantia polymorpha]